MCVLHNTNTMKHINIVVCFYIQCKLTLCFPNSFNAYFYNIWCGRTCSTSSI